MLVKTVEEKNRSGGLCMGFLFCVLPLLMKIVGIEFIHMKTLLKVQNAGVLNYSKSRVGKVFL